MTNRRFLPDVPKYPVPQSEAEFKPVVEVLQADLHQLLNGHQASVCIAALSNLLIKVMKARRTLQQREVIIREIARLCGVKL